MSERVDTVADARIRLALLGAPVVEVEGAPLEVDTRKGTALLVYLAVSAHERRRDTLATLLWPDYDEAHARAALRRTLSALNKGLHGAGLIIGRTTVAFDPTVASVDVTEFRALGRGCRRHTGEPALACRACHEALLAAVSLYRDDFLAGFSLRDSPGFDDWSAVESEALRRELFGALGWLASSSVALGDVDAAIGHATRWLALDPLHEPAHQALMRLYASAGRRSAAVRQYRDCVAVLESELGVAPLEETTRLYASIRDAGAPRDVQAAPQPTPSRRAGAAGAPELPLVGRAKEWDELSRAYDAVAEDGRFVAVQGEAGIGKTRLVEDFLAWGRQRGATSISARSHEDETNLAYGLVIDALTSAVRAGRLDWTGGLADRTLVEASRLVPELAEARHGLPPAPALDGPGARSRFLEAVVEVLCAAVAGDRPGIVFLDDLHWADDSSLELVAYLVRRLRGRPVCIVAAWRAEQSGQPRLATLVAAAQRAGAGVLVRPARLEPTHVQQLVQAAVSPPDAPAADISQRLLQETEGLPLFVVEYLAALEEGSGDAWALPEGIRDLVSARLSTLSETGRQLLTTAAVIGRSFDLDIARAASGRSEEEAVAAIEELAARGFIEEVRSGGGRALEYDFSHDKLRSIVLERCSLARLRLLHGRVADALIRRGDAEGERVAGVIANHLRAAGRDAEAAVAFKQAGERAMALGATGEALSYMRTALGLGHPDAGSLDETIGDLLTLIGDYSGALEALEAAAARGDDHRLGVIEHKIGIVHQRRGEWEAADSHFEAALAVSRSARADGGPARVIADRSLTAHRRGRPEQADEFARASLEAAEAAGDARALAQAHNILGILAKSRGDLDSGRAHLERSLALSETLPDAGARVSALNNLALALGAGGDVDAALALIDEALGLCAAQGDRHREAALHNNKADLLHAAGDTGSAMAHLKRAVAIFAEIGEPDDPRPEIWKLFEW
jgi:DNA-binding SARP family transcriptional activator